MARHARTKRARREAERLKCERKVAHITRDAALATKRHMKARGKFVETLEPYQCSVGPHWHLGSRKIR